MNHLSPRRIFAIAAAVCIAAGELCAAGESVDTLKNVTVTARRSPVRVMAHTPVQQLTSTAIDRLGILDMADAVRRFAGTTVRDYGGIGGLKTVSVRNMGAAHTGVSYDGVPVSNCQGGQIDIGRFSLDNISTLSLAVGTTDDLLQPATLYASGAILGIATVQPEFEGSRHNAFRATLKGGSFGFVNPSMRWWFRPTSKSSTAVEADFMRADGNYPYTLVNGLLVTRERRNNSAIDSWHAEANFNYDFSPFSALQVKAYWYNSRRGLPGAVTLYNPVSTETLWDRNAFVQARWRATLSSSWRLQAAAKYNYGWNRDRELSPQFTGGVYQDTHRQDEYYLTATAAWEPVQPLTVALATDAAINTLESTLAACPFPRRFTSISALTARWRNGRLTANATLTGTFITEHVRTGANPSDIFRLNPAVSASVQPFAEEMLFVRAMYKNSFRTPSFNDLYYERAGNRTLRPEKAREMGLGITWNRRLLPCMDYFALTVDGYYNIVSDKIVAFPTPYTWRMVNYGKVRAHGIDITAATSFSLPYGLGIELSGAYSWQRALNLSDPSAKEYHGQLPYTPVNSGNYAITVTSPWVNLGYSGVAVGKRYFMAQNIQANEIDGYLEQTLTLSRSFSLRSTTLDVRAELVNLADVTYEVIRYYPMPGRSWRLVASYKF